MTTTSQVINALDTDVDVIFPLQSFTYTENITSSIDGKPYTWEYAYPPCCKMISSTWPYQGFTGGSCGLQNFKLTVGHNATLNQTVNLNVLPLPTSANVYTTYCYNGAEPSSLCATDTSCTLTTEIVSDMFDSIFGERGVFFNLSSNTQVTYKVATTTQIVSVEGGTAFLITPDGTYPTTGEVFCVAKLPSQVPGTYPEYFRFYGNPPITVVGTGVLSAGMTQTINASTTREQTNGAFPSSTYQQLSDPSVTYSMGTGGTPFSITLNGLVFTAGSNPPPLSATLSAYSDIMDCTIVGDATYSNFTVTLSLKSSVVKMINSTNQVATFTGGGFLKFASDGTSPLLKTGTMPASPSEYVYVTNASNAQFTLS